jgi:hypothetical protein
MDRWVDLLEWPVWLLALAYVSCCLLRLLVEEIARRRIVKPVADQFDRALSSASRVAHALVRLVAAPKSKQHYVLMAEAGHFQVGNNRPPQVLGWDRGHRLLYGRNNPGPLTPDRI